MKVDNTKLEKIKEKVRKLFNLGTSSNEHESALALKRANEIIDKYNLDVAEILKKNPKDISGSSVTVNSGYKRLIVWYRDLAFLVSRMFDVEWCYKSGYKASYGGEDRGPNLKIVFYGVTLNAEMAAYAFTAIRNQIWDLLSNINIDYSEYELSLEKYRQGIENYLKSSEYFSDESELPDQIREVFRIRYMRKWSSKKAFVADYKKSYCQGLVDTIGTEVDKRKDFEEQENSQLTTLVICYEDVARRVREESGLRIRYVRSRSSNGTSRMGYRHGVSDRSKVVVTQGLR